VEVPRDGCQALHWQVGMVHKVVQAGRRWLAEEAATVQ